MRAIALLLTGFMLFFFAGPAHAATGTTDRALSLAAPISASAAGSTHDDQLFAAQPVSDAALASSYAGAPVRDYIRRANDSYAAGTFQHNAAVARIGVDNWMHDIAAPLIFSNVVRLTMT